MVKIVMPSEQVIHAWAAQTQPEGRNAGGTISFTGADLYSYRTQIATMHESVAEGGGKVALFEATGRRSMTTNKQLSQARSAVRHLPNFTVPNSSPQWNVMLHPGNIAHLLAELTDYIGKLTRARTIYGGVEELTINVRERQDQVRSYCHHFGQEVPSDINLTLTPDAIAASIMATRDAAEAKRNTPAEIAKRTKKRAAEIIAREERERADRNMRIVREEEQRANFRNMLPYYGHCHDGNNGALIRKIGDELQTSWGARVPFSHAVRVFRMVRNCRDDGKAYAPGHSAMRVGLFTVNRIDADGTLHVGCHRINWPEIERLARETGVFDTVAA